MARSHLPAVRSSDSLAPKLTKKEKKLIKKMAEGYAPYELANKHGKTEKEKKQLRAKYRRLAARPEAIEYAAVLAQGTANVALVPVMDAVVKRAMRGRMDAAKYIGEVTGFHNPKVQHEHSGDISITLKGVPRPQQVSTEDSNIVDAEVVE